MTFTLEQIAAALGMAAPARARVTGWSVDTRTLLTGDLFLGLRGPVDDGNVYLEVAFAKGACGAIAERGSEAGPVLQVADGQAALHRLAAWARAQWPGEIIGVTGSAGKTSTKDVIASLLLTQRATAKTQGNFNNHVGLPLSILRMPEQAELAVLEIGMNHSGEIRDLAAIAKPRVGVVTNVGSAHIEFFDSVDGIAAAKRELIEALPANGVAVLNADDARVVRFGEAHPGQTITFGLSEGADVRAENVRFESQSVCFRAQGTEFKTCLTGRHNVRNILAGIAVAGIYGIAPGDLRDAVHDLQPAPMRGERTWYDGIELLNDCYNSNPDAAKSMLDVLRDTPATRRIAVLGEMLELGRWSESLHRDVGNYAAASGIDVLVGIRGAAKTMADAAIIAGLPATAAYFFEDPTEAGVHLRTIAREGDAILFKGSRGTHVERAMETFTAGAVQAHP